MEAPGSRRLTDRTDHHFQGAEAAVLQWRAVERVPRAARSWLSLGAMTGLRTSDWKIKLSADTGFFIGGCVNLLCLQLF